MFIMVQTVAMTDENKGVLSTGDLLRKYRKEKGCTLQDVADAVGCSPSYLHRLENSDRKNPSINMAAKLAMFYDVDVSLLTGTESGLSNASDMIDFKSNMSKEVDSASQKIQDGLRLLDLDPELSKSHFVDVLKSLLYLKSML